MPSRLKILLVTPASAGSRAGNRVTADRWEDLLVELGHEARVEEALEPSTDAEIDLLIALHATRSADSIERYRREKPSGRLIVACTGTDLYRDLQAGDPATLRSIDRADRLVTLHSLAEQELPARLRSRVRVIVQSVRLPADLDPAPERPPHPAEVRPEDAPGARLRVLISAHLREVKDPLRAAHAAELLPADSRVEITHLGGMREPEFDEPARRASREGGRYRWRGEVDRDVGLRVLAQSHCLLISSRMEGAPNVLSEAFALGVPVLATDIPGCVGLLGSDHPALYPPGDTRALAHLLRRVETDLVLYRELETRSRERAPLVRPEAEREAWRQLLSEWD